VALLPSSQHKILAVYAGVFKGFPQKNPWSSRLTESVKQVDGIGVSEGASRVSQPVDNSILCG
jgi:hypothetical protein